MVASDLLSLIFLALFWVHATHADSTVDMIARSCRKTPVRNASLYVDGYWHLVVSMEQEMVRNKFAFNEMGEPPDRIYLFSQCMNDLSGEECKMCFDQMKTLLPSCFPNTGGRVYADGCFLRAENYSFFEEIIEPVDDMQICSDSMEGRQGFNDTTRELVMEIAKDAPHNRGHAVQHQELESGASVYAMANCWKTINAEMCSICLGNAAMASLSCLPSSGGRVMNAGCFLRYADYDFFSSSTEAPSMLSYAIYATGVVALCTFTITIGFCVGKTAYQESIQEPKLKRMETDLSVQDKSLQFLQFKYSTLERATDCFNEAHKLGQGGYGEVFKGTLPDGREIAIKRLYVSGKGRTDDVYNEMDIIRRAQHKNLVRFLGCCFTHIDSFLVYEFLANKSLDHFLFDPEKKKELDWNKRLGIIIGTAEGLEYLHMDSQVRIVHRDIKASNILLDLRHKPKIADFGLARFYSCDESLISTAIAGTLGYIAPEYLAHGRLTEKVDVYSFGVLVLEIVSGHRNSEFQPTETFETLVTNAWKRFQSKTVTEIIDVSMEMEDVEEATRVIQVGLLCTQESASLRPTMTTVIQMLREKDAHLPVPSKPPFTEESMEISPSFESSRRRPSCLSDLCTFHSFKTSEPE
ncbi:cysteine-rich receptor-like protein kinase 46 [Corylus avellana]|uniref:cysteine-rich receptor-like protein kinase 46 n=1 Tax=Corylus avellana TaxID=13451 RepID=UPI00286B5234|nr:cysteine-rich receptor-like protein kinase 46 [Corylus avellana]